MSCASDGGCKCSLVNRDHFEHFIAIVVDDLHGDLAGFRRVEGYPTALLFTRHDLERQFRRI